MILKKIVKSTSEAQLGLVSDWLKIVLTPIYSFVLLRAACNRDFARHEYQVPPERLLKLEIIINFSI